MNWAGKAERISIDVPTVSLHVHEKIDPRTIIEAVKKSEKEIWEQMNLFNRPVNKLSFIKEIEFYQHKKDWANRLVAGDSMLVMNSLIEREGLGGKVQVVYIDPPYGIRYGSNFQPFVSQKEVKDKDSDLSQEPEMIRAFRDTWELGIHSYLTYMRDRLLLARQLLSDKGSVFVQISDENVHHVRELLDEVFGPKNFMSLITFQKTGSMAGNFLASTVDFLVWYAKDKSKVKYRQVYQNRAAGDPSLDRYDQIELSDGTCRRIAQSEVDEENIPAGRRFRLTSLFSDGASEGGSFDYQFNGKSYSCAEGSHWKTSKQGLDRLAKAGRLIPADTRLNYKRYLDDFSVIPISDRWESMQLGKSRLYCVQTAEAVVERCMLMTSDPGDLVFDPTCGSGTTAAVAERWGRRWITCDTSRIAIAIAKQRLLTSTFDYYMLSNNSEGVDSGLEYETVPHITLGSIAKLEDIDRLKDKPSIEGLIAKKADQEALVDSPKRDLKKIRVSGPFTVEAVPAPVVTALGAEQNEGGTVSNNIVDWIQELQKTGIRMKNKQMIKLSRLEALSGTRWLHAEGNTDEDVPQKVLVSFGPAFAPFEQKQVEMALLEAEKIKPSPTIIVFAAFQFDPEAAKDINSIEWGGVSVIKVQMNADLFTDDLKKKRASNESFWLVGQPDIRIEKIKSGDNKGKYQVRVNGFDYYNPKSGSVDSGGADKISMWMLDTDYDGRSLLPRQVFFPMAGKKDGWSKLAKSLNAEIDQELIEAFRGTDSLPFETGENRKIAVKIVDDRGIESLVVEEINE